LPLLCYNETLCENESCYGEGTKWLPITVVGLRLSGPKSVYLKIGLSIGAVMGSSSLRDELTGLDLPVGNDRQTLKKVDLSRDLIDGENQFNPGSATWFSAVT
jgi:hypothetical protein